MNTQSEKHCFGMLAEFESVESLIQAAKKTTEAGYLKTDAYSPFPIEGMDPALGIKRTILPLFVLIAGIIGFVSGYGLEYWTTVIDYPINIGARPLHSAPAFIPVAYECTILFASLTAAFGMLAMNGFPRPHHPLFNVEAFSSASQTGFFLSIESEDKKFDLKTTSDFLKSIGAKNVYEVPME